MTVVVDSYTRVLLTVIAILLGVVAVGMWCESPVLVDSAKAGIPDSGKQLDEVIAQLKEVNETLLGISETMVSGNIKVQVADPSETKKKAATRTAATTVPSVPK